MISTGDSPLSHLVASPTDTGLNTSTGLPLSDPENDQFRYLNNSLDNIPETAAIATPHQPTDCTPAQFADTRSSKSNRMEATNTSTDSVSASLYIKFVQTTLPNAGKRNRQTPSIRLDRHRLQTKSSKRLPSNEGSTST